MSGCSSACALLITGRCWLFIKLERVVLGDEDADSKWGHVEKFVYNRELDLGRSRAVELADKAYDIFALSEGHACLEVGLVDLPWDRSESRSRVWMGSDAPNSFIGGSSPADDEQETLMDDFALFDIGEGDEILGVGAVACSRAHV